MGHEVNLRRHSKWNVGKKQRFDLHLVSIGVEFRSFVTRRLIASALRRSEEMKRLYLVLTLVLLMAVSNGCRTGRCRLRGAKCRPGMSMPTYTQPPGSVPAQPPVGPYNPGFPSPGCAPTGFGYPPGYGCPPAGAYVPSGAFITGDETTSGEVVVQEFPTTPIEGQTQVLQRPIIDSSVTESDDGSVITVPGPEMGPLPNS